jgi:hypothetical protein
MTISYRKRITFGAGALLMLALAGCHDDGYNPADHGTPPPDASTVNDLATTQINTKTCDQLTPDDVSAVTVSDTDDAIDVSTLTPACAGSS